MIVSTPVAAFLTALVIGLGLIPLCRAAALRAGFVAHPRNDRWHRQTVPMMGGVGIALALFAAAAWWGTMQGHPVLLATAVVVFLIGFVDDLLQVKPFTKLIGQIAVASALVYFDYLLGWNDSRLLDSLLTMVWIVGITNAFNLLDNMDGLCAGTALIVSVALIVGLSTGATREVASAEVIYLAALAGAVSSFLVYNFPPASVFMGDSGSLLLGFSLAALTLSNAGVRGSRSDVLSVIAGPVLVLLLPIFDTTLVTVARLLSGRSPAVGGRDHSSHRLVAIGFSERTAVFLLWLIAAIGGAIGVTVRNAGQGFSVLMGGLFVILIGLLAVHLSRVRVYDEVHAPGPAATVTPITPLEGELMYKRRVLEVLLDFCAIIASYYLANQYYFDREAYLANAEVFYSSLPLVVAVQLIAFFTVGVYRGPVYIRLSRAAVVLVAGVLAGSVAVYGVFGVLFLRSRDSLGVLAIHAALLVVFMLASRAVERRLAAILAYR